MRVELFRESVRGAEVNCGPCVFAGEGERERRAGAVRWGSEGAEGDETKPRLGCFPGACSCECEREAPRPDVLRLGYRGLAPLVRSRNECCAGCGELRAVDAGPPSSRTAGGWATGAASGTCAGRASRRG